MTSRILRIDSSIKGAESVSRQLTDRIIARLSAAHPGAEIVTRDLAQLPPPAISGNWLGAVYTPAEARDAEQQEAAKLTGEMIAELKAADVVVIGLPVYNFAVPAPLKAWLDHLAVKGETFHYTEEGPVGLVEGTRAIIAMSSDGTEQGSAIDFATPYLRHMLTFFGITEIDVIAADRLAFDREAGLKAANDAVEALTLAG